MLHGGARIVPEWDLYLQAVERRRRRMERTGREKRRGTHAMRGIAMACLFGLIAYTLLLAF